MSKKHPHVKNANGSKTIKVYDEAKARIEIAAENIQHMSDALIEMLAQKLIKNVEHPLDYTLVHERDLDSKKIRWWFEKKSSIIKPNSIV